MKSFAIALLASESLAISLGHFVENTEYFDRQFDEPQANQFDGYIHLADGKKLDALTWDEVHDDDLNVMTSFIENYSNEFDRQFVFNGEPIAVVQQTRQNTGNAYMQFSAPVDKQEDYTGTETEEEWVNRDIQEATANEIEQEKKNVDEGEAMWESLHAQYQASEDY